LGNISRTYRANEACHVGTNFRIHSKPLVGPILQSCVCHCSLMCGGLQRNPIDAYVRRIICVDLTMLGLVVELDASWRVGRRAREFSASQPSSLPLFRANPPLRPCICLCLCLCRNTRGKIGRDVRFESDFAATGRRESEIRISILNETRALLSLFLPIKRPNCSHKLLLRLDRNHVNSENFLPCSALAIVVTVPRLCDFCHQSRRDQKARRNWSGSNGKTCQVLLVALRLIVSRASALRLWLLKRQKYQSLLSTAPRPHWTKASTSQTSCWQKTYQKAELQRLRPQRRSSGCCPPQGLKTLQTPISSLRRFRYVIQFLRLEVEDSVDQHKRLGNPRAQIQDLCPIGRHCSISCRAGHQYVFHFHYQNRSLNNSGSNRLVRLVQSH
jgi:hypothetical protein